MNLIEECIERDRLRGHFDGALSAEESAKIIAHLDTCVLCQQSLETLSGDSELVELARAATRPISVDATLLSLLEKLKGERASGELGRDIPERLGHYRVLAVAGRGGMGVALKALDEKLGRLVCLKVFTTGQAASRPGRERILREARAAAGIDSEFVVKIFAVEESAQPPHLAMEFVTGPSLQSIIDAGPLPIARVLEIGRQVSEGLAAAHARGIVHRDIKPGNILLEAESGRAKISDFGLARAADDGALTTEGAIAGTPEYMAPEQARGGKVDSRCDLFSLGTLLYAMCIGRSPFRAENSLAVLRRILDDTPQRLDRVRGDVPPGLSDLVRRLHARDPANRMASAEEVSLALRQIAAGEYVPAGMGRRAWIASAIGVVLGGGAFAAWRGRTTNEASSPSLDEQMRGSVGAVPVARKPRVLVVVPPTNFYPPDFYPVCMWLATHEVKYQVASTNMHRCQPEERSRQIAEAEGRDVSVRPDLIINYARPSEYDAVYFVGGPGVLVYAVGGTHADIARELIEGFVKANKVVSAAGTAPVVLAEAGVLKGRRAGCYPYGEPYHLYVKRLEAAGAVWIDEPIVEDGLFVTTGQPRFIEEFAQALLKRLGVEPRRYRLPVSHG